MTNAIKRDYEHTYADHSVHTGNTRSPAALAFLAAVTKVCIEHGFSIGHEDGHGAFEITADTATGWLESAHEIRCPPEPTEQT